MIMNWNREENDENSSIFLFNSVFDWSSTKLLKDDIKFNENWQAGNKRYFS